MIDEPERLLSLFRQLLLHTSDYLQELQPGDWIAVPKDSPTLLLGTRVRRITIAALVRHLISAERHWLAVLHELADGGTIPLPDEALAEALPDGPELRPAFARAIEEILGLANALTPTDLEKEVVFAERRYSGLGLLWTMVAHHAYHLGQIDLLMRQQGLRPPDFLEWPDTREVVV